MARSEQVTCDICKTRMEPGTNHWFKGYRLPIAGQAETNYKFYGGGMVLPFAIYPNDKIGQVGAGGLMLLVDLCGAEHATQWLGKQL